jgi:hypothetical protein
MDRVLARCGVDDEDLVVGGLADEAAERDPRAVRRNVREGRKSAEVGELRRLAAVLLDGPQLECTALVAAIDDVPAVRRVLRAEMEPGPAGDRLQA